MTPPSHIAALLENSPGVIFWVVFRRAYKVLTASKAKTVISSPFK